MTLLKELENYCADILSDKIPSCRKHKHACMRFLSDIKKQNTPSFPYVFVEAKAERFFDWMQLFNHTKGPLAGTPKIPDIIEKFIFGQLYGWVHVTTGYRRFRNVYWQVARKNAKSQDLAIVGLYELAAFGESSPEVYVAATKKEQTIYVWGEADAIYRRCDLLRDKFKTAYGTIWHKKSGGKFARMTKEDRKKGDGSNPQCGILDEYHAHETDEYYNILTSGMKIRTQPVLLIITTAGFDLNHPCYRDEYDYVSKILDPDNPIENDRYLALVCELDRNDTKDKLIIDGREIAPGELIDDVKDPKVWIKSNPILAKTKEGAESIAAELKVALDKREKMRDFLTKTMDIWINERAQGYMQMKKWAACVGVIPDVKGRGCFIGFDMSARIDLTSVGFEFPIEDKYYLLSHSFMPEETLTARMKTDKVPYDRWASEGFITVTPGAVTDYRAMREYVEKFIKESGCAVNKFCLDSWGATQLIADLIEAYGSDKVEEVIQGVRSLSEPTKDLRYMVHDKRIVHDGNPVLSWAVGNAIADIHANENMMLNKAKSTNRIDPLMAIINAHFKAMIPVDQGYNARGMRTL